MDSQIQNIIFDWGGVLLNLDMERCFSAFEAAGAKDIRCFLTGTNEMAFFKDYECGLISTAQFRDEVRHLIGRNIPDIEIDRMWSSMLGDIPTEKLTLIDALSRRYRLYLLSNTNELHWNHASAHVFRYKGRDLKECFRHIFLSFNMGLGKPDPEIFRKAILEAGINAEDTVFIDDSQVNCRAAEDVGIRAMHYQPGTDLSKLFI